MSKVSYDIIERALKTFIQTFLATWAVTGYDFEKGAVIGAVAASISAVMNIIVSPREISEPK